MLYFIFTKLLISFLFSLIIPWYAVVLNEENDSLKEKMDHFT